MTHAGVVAAVSTNAVIIRTNTLGVKLRHLPGVLFRRNEDLIYEEFGYEYEDV